MTSDLCIVLSLYERRKGKEKKNVTGVVLFKVLIWILFLYPNDVYFAFCKLNLNEYARMFKVKGRGCCRALIH